MSISGKILIILNLLVASVFLYIATLDWAARNKWAYAVYRDNLALNGLPLNAKADDPLDYSLAAENLSDNTMKQIFASFGDPVRTQAEEVQRVQRRLSEELNAITDEKARRQKWVTLLLPLANNTAEMDEIRKREADPKVTWANLEQELTDLFADALSPEVVSDGSSISIAPSQEKKPILAQMLPRDKRRAIAHLLFNLHPKDDPASIEADHLRQQVVIGLKAFAEEAQHQGEAAVAIAEQINLMMVGDRAAFEIDYNGKLDGLRDRAEGIASLNNDVAGQQKAKEDHTKLRDDRKKDVETAKDRLAESIKETAKALELQAEQEKILFKSQRFLGGGHAENERLERQIRLLEKATPATPQVRP
jgi:hypothetical protein